MRHDIRRALPVLPLLLVLAACGTTAKDRRDAAGKAIYALREARVALVAWDGAHQQGLARKEPLDAAKAALATHQARMAKLEHILGFTLTALALAVTEPSIANLSEATRLLIQAHAEIRAIRGDGQ